MFLRRQQERKQANWCQSLAVLELLCRDIVLYLLCHEWFRPSVSSFIKGEHELPTKPLQTKIIICTNEVAFVMHGNNSDSEAEASTEQQCSRLRHLLHRKSYRHSSSPTPNWQTSHMPIFHEYWQHKMLPKMKFRLICYSSETHLISLGNPLTSRCSWNDEDTEVHIYPIMLLDWDWDWDWEWKWEWVR
jgi:hypothetical protein